MITAKELTYEKIYYSLWETAQRYTNFCQFRVIGNSHDERMIPMVEIGKGSDCLFCISGLWGTDAQTPGYLAKMVQEYCQAYECGWELEELYHVRKLLDQVRLCFIPLLNPDGWEICRQGYGMIRNPIYRQMLKMQGIPYEEFTCNARLMDLRNNFPTAYYKKERIGQEPSSENETKALIRIFQEYSSRGLLSFTRHEGKILYCSKPQSFSYNQRSYRLARYLQRASSYHLDKLSLGAQTREERKSSRSPEKYYAQTVKQPALMIEMPETQEDHSGEKAYQEIHLLPLEYLFVLDK